MMRILHISDLHAPAEVPRDQKRIVQALLADVAEQDRAQRIDLVLFSGDLSDDGSPQALAAARALLLDPLASVLPTRPVLLTPGNHDVERGQVNAVIEAGLQAQLCDGDRVAALLADEETFAQARRRLESWDRLKHSWEQGVTAPSQTGLLWCVHRLDLNGCSVGVATLDSAWRSSGDGDHGGLIVGEPALRAALEAIDSCELRLVVVHHPLDWLARFDAESTQTLLERAGVFVFTGHEHTPDPTTEISTRGAALYSRAGCLYAGSAYSNSYTIVDLHPSSQLVRVSVRRWWPSRAEFDAATDLHRGGSFELAWPRRTNALATLRSSVSEVLAPLAQIAQEQSLIAGELTLTSNVSVSDLLVAPRFWPVPNREAIESTVPAERRPKPVDAIQALAQARVLIVSGEASSGVTSSLLWLIEQHFRLHGTALPAYVRADERFSLGRINQALAGARAHAAGGEGVPLVVAVDDADLSDRRAQARLVRFLAENPDVTLILGCHEEQHTPIAQTLDTHGITFERVFLAPFGRREMRHLITRIAGPNSAELVQRVLSVIHGQGLARNPLNVAALVAVVTREEDLTELNESGLLQAYVSVLLENPVASDPEGLAMDYRRREHFLSQLAAHLVRANRTRLARLEAEQFVVNYYERLGWASASAGHLLDSLIRRRVLSQTDMGVGFRYSALLHLFAAKAAIEDESFAATLLADVVRYAEVIRHTAGLRRNDQQLLTAVGERTAQIVRAAVAGADVSLFELITDRDGWSQIDDLQQARALARTGPPPTEEELDQLYEDMAEEPADHERAEAFPPADTAASGLEQLGPPVQLLASVLKSSELVADVELKARMLREVVLGWGLATVLLAVREDETGELRGILLQLFADETDEQKRRSAADHFSRVLVVSFMVFDLYAGTGSVHLQGVLDQVLDDDKFVSAAANDLFATMLYAMLEFPRWPERLRQLHERHGAHPMVREVARHWALRRYANGDFKAGVEKALEDVLVEMLMPANRPAAGHARAAQSTEIRDTLRANRRRAQWTQGSQETKALEG